MGNFEKNWQADVQQVSYLFPNTCIICAFLEEGPRYQKKELRQAEAQQREKTDAGFARQL